ncbi:MAG: magnesium/cobalt transporter CorA [Candidatus Marinimicrobia bacterium]|nr:magnesium/cobalt transporter CorA [Candidatus Neomarinimicrobiota bacterium]
MATKAQSYSVKAGLPPGSLIHIGGSEPNKTIISKIEYSAKSISEYNDITIDDLKIRTDDLNTWINITGLADIDVISTIGEQYDINHLVLEDILNTQHRPKIEEFDDYTFFTFKMLRLGKARREITSEQVSIILGKNYVLTFQEVEGDTFDSVRNRLNNQIGKIRTRGADYLLYTLVDTVVDSYFSIIDTLNENIQKLEDQIISNPSNDVLEKIQYYKKDVQFLRKTISPLRDSVGFLCKADTNLIADGTTLYFKDTFDHILHINDSLNEMRDNLTSQLEIFHSNLSDQMNAVMKVLTIIATIFIPLTFIAGIYGMNFKFMPELDWYWGYPSILGIMAIIFISMIYYFKKNNWI